jgi:hypothetical protein
MVLATSVFSAMRAKHDGFIPVIWGAVCLTVLVAFVVPWVGAPLVVTDEGIRGFINYHRMRIPWSSVRSFEIRDLQGLEQATSVVVLHSNNGKQILLPCTRGNPAHAEAIAEELRQAHREHGGALDAV